MQNLRPTKGIQQQPRPLAGREGSKAQQTPPRPAGLTADGFLTHTFLPLYEPPGKLPEIPDTERDVFNSLALLQQHFDLRLPDVRDKEYPYNVLLTYHEAERQIRKGKNNKELFIVADEAGQVKFSVRETVFNNSTLYYIPVLPLYRLLESGKDKKAAELLLSVSAYLCQSVNIPHYREDDSYLSGNYDMLCDWLTDPYNDWEEADLIRNKSALNAATHFGDIMLRRMYAKYNLEQMPVRVQTFEPASQFDRDCLEVAKIALTLSVSHPDGYLFRHVKDDLGDSGEPDEDKDDYYDRRDNTLLVEQYVHFIAEAGGSVYDNLVEMINSEFNEKQYAQEPNLVTYYDNSLKEKADSLEFEYGLFELIDKLCNILFELK